MEERKMRKTVLAFVVALAFIAVPAVASNLGFFAGGSSPILSEGFGGRTTTIVKGGMNYAVNASNSADGESLAAWVGGPITIPDNEATKKIWAGMDSTYRLTGVFPEFDYLRFDIYTLGVSSQQIVKRQVVSCDPCIRICYDKCSVIATASSIPNGVSALTFSQDQRASRSDLKIPIIPFLWYARFASNPLQTDYTAATVMKKDPTYFIEWYAQEWYGKQAKSLLPAELMQIRKQYLDKEIGCFSLVHSEPLSDDLRFIARNKALGLPPPFAPRQQAVTTTMSAATTAKTGFKVSLFAADGSPYGRSDVSITVKSAAGVEQTLTGGPCVDFPCPDGTYAVTVVVPGVCTQVFQNMSLSAGDTMKVVVREVKR